MIGNTHATATAASTRRNAPGEHPASRRASAHNAVALAVALVLSLWPVVAL